MSLSREDVEKVSHLARLLLSPQELDRMTSQLSSIVDYVQQLSELDTDGVQPMAHAVELTNILSEDRQRPSFDRQRMLASAPHHDDEYYRVPAVLGD